MPALDNLTDEGIHRLGLILAIQAEIEGLKAENAEAVANGCTAPYHIGHFQEKAQEIETKLSGSFQPSPTLFHKQDKMTVEKI